jgi:FkbM family methyltransferase
MEDIGQILDCNDELDAEAWLELLLQLKHAQVPRRIVIENASKADFNGEYNLYPTSNRSPEWAREVPDGGRVYLYRKKKGWCLGFKQGRISYSLEASKRLKTDHWPASTHDWCRGRGTSRPTMSSSQLLKRKLCHLDSIGKRSFRIFYMDLDILKEHKSRRTKYKLDLDDTAVFLDIGAHAGVVSLKALQLGVQQVICVEPSFFSFVLLHRNLAPEVREGKAVILHRALGQTSDTVGRLWRHKGGDGQEFFNMTDTCATSQLARPHSGQPEYCLTISMTELLVTYRPTDVKLDCEGSENLLQTASPEALVTVKNIYGEYDAKHHPLVTEQKAFNDFLERCGFQVEWLDKMDSTVNPDGEQVFAKRLGFAAKNTGMMFIARRVMGRA